MIVMMTLQLINIMISVLIVLNHYIVDILSHVIIFDCHKLPYLLHFLKKISVSSFLFVGYKQILMQNFQNDDDSFFADTFIACKRIRKEKYFNSSIYHCRDITNHKNTKSNKLSSLTGKLVNVQ